MKTSRILIFVSVLFVLATACSQPEEDARRKGTADALPAYGDILVDGSIGDASNLIPILSSDSASTNVSGLVFNGLVKYDKDMNVVGDLAESWDVSKNGLVITFHLRKGVRWHDGAPFTAEDVLFTYRLTIDPKTPTAYAGDFLKVKKAEVLDPHTFRVTYDRPFAPALMSWAPRSCRGTSWRGRTSSPLRWPGSPWGRDLISSRSG